MNATGQAHYQYRAEDAVQRPELRAPLTAQPYPAAVVTESAADEPWAAFCKTLSRPAFLLADRAHAASE